MTRIHAHDLTNAVIGRKLTAYSHVGEDPASDERRYDTLEVLGGRGYTPIIVGVRHDDADNHVAILLDDILTRLWRHPDTGKPERLADGNWRMEPTDPPEGRHELGFDRNGWIEVQD